MLRGEYVSHVAKQSEAVAHLFGSLTALPRGRWLLAVSGGRDSMVLLDAMAATRADEIAAVATFDHGTGVAATRAAALVERRALALELPAIRGSAPIGKRSGTPSGTPTSAVAASEASWREARWRFLRGWAAELNATVVTAHTWDDQVETVLMRLMRDAGPRGLGGMRSGRAEATPVLRPLLQTRRAEIEAYAEARRVTFIEDPSNADLRYLRNRVRRELLPALERATPGFGAWCWDLSCRAAAWREELQRLVDERLAPSLDAVGSLVLRVERTTGFAAAHWALLWPELAARLGVVMDRRGIARAAAWAPRAAAGSEIQLAGGARIARTRTTFVIHAP